MITVAVRKNSIAVSGHAQRPAGVPPGRNIICAAVSAITQNLLDGLMNIAMEEVESAGAQKVERTALRAFVLVKHF